jgi:hypothetical protein
MMISLLFFTPEKEANSCDKTFLKKLVSQPFDHSSAENNTFAQSVLSFQRRFSKSQLQNNQSDDGDDDTANLEQEFTTFARPAKFFPVVPLSKTEEQNIFSRISLSSPRPNCPNEQKIAQEEEESKQKDETSKSVIAEEEQRVYVVFSNPVLDEERKQKRLEEESTLKAHIRTAADFIPINAQGMRRIDTDDLGFALFE